MTYFNRCLRFVLAEDPTGIYDYSCSIDRCIANPDESGLRVLTPSQLINMIIDSSKKQIKDNPDEPLQIGLLFDSNNDGLHILAQCHIQIDDGREPVFFACQCEDEEAIDGMYANEVFNYLIEEAQKHGWVLERNIGKDARLWLTNNINQV